MKKIILPLIGLSLLMSCAAPEVITKAPGMLTNTIGVVSDDYDSTTVKKCYQNDETPYFLTATNKTVDIDVTLRDFNSAHPDFENFNSKKKAPDANDCGSLDQAELQDYDLKKKYYDDLRERFPLHYHWASLNAREIYPTFGMVKNVLNAKGKPEKAREACDNANFHEWYNDVDGVNHQVQDKIQLSEIASDTYQVEFYHHKGNSYLPLDRFAQSPDVKTWGKQNNNDWCKDDQMTCRKVSDDNGQKRNSVPEGSNFGFTMVTGWDFIYTSLGGESLTIDGDDDHWLFVDGRLVVDAGGAHVSTLSSIQFDELADKYHWIEGSRHSLKLFFAERQTDASNLTLTLKSKLAQKLSDLPPYIMDAIILDPEASKLEYILYLNSELDSKTLVALLSTPNAFSVVNSSFDEVGASIQMEKIEVIDTQELPKGVIQGLRLVLKNGSTALTLDHKIAFNTKLGFEVKSKTAKVLKINSHAQFQSLNVYTQNRTLITNVASCK